MNNEEEYEIAQLIAANEQLLSEKDAEIQQLKERLKEIAEAWDAAIRREKYNQFE